MFYRSSLLHKILISRHFNDNLVPELNKVELFDLLEPKKIGNFWSKTHLLKMFCCCHEVLLIFVHVTVNWYTDTEWSLIVINSGCVLTWRHKSLILTFYDKNKKLLISNSRSKWKKGVDFSASSRIILKLNTYTCAYFSVL